MNIKERFYANLDLIREDWEKDAADWSKKRADNSRFAKSQAKADHLLARIDPNYRKEKEKEAKHYKKLSKKYAKKAVTGMDEEAEQLDELSRKTLGNYIKKAHKNTNKLTLTLDNSKAPKEYAKQAERKFRNRNKGIERAADKLSR